MKLIVSILLLFSGFYIKAQKVFETKNINQADIKVLVVDNSYQADLKVYKVTNSTMADVNRGKWFFTNQAITASKRIYFTSSAYNADLKIYYVNYESLAGWVNKEKKHCLIKTNIIKTIKPAQ